MRRVLFAGFVFAAFFFINLLPVMAEPTIFGPTGLIVNPTADITPLEHAWIALNFLDNGDNSIWNANLATAISEEFEIGVGAIHPENGDDGFSFFVKWLFSPETENFPGAAGGVTVTDVSNENSAMWYVVASKFFELGEHSGQNASIHGGLSYVSGDTDEDFEYFGGFDFEFAENMIAIAEYNSSSREVFQGLTYGLRYYFGPRFTGQAGFIDGNLHIGGSFVF
jgi:hypothetical protein